MEAKIGLDAAVIRIAKSDFDSATLVGKLNKINDMDCVIQIFSKDKVINKTHLIGAYVNAASAFANKSNISNGMAMEMMLFAAMTRQIKDAIDIIGADGKEFVIFANSEQSYKKAKGLVKDERDFTRSKDEERKIAKTFGISTNDHDLDGAILQRMAVSRIED
ncbi:MAG: hypothetical protein M1504_03470 [Candidatus Marsarchaeota archaeon]|nr:hypothetical protein [Candidatus Marsarchaeota archaeon]